MFRSRYHVLLMGECREGILWQNVEAEETDLVEARATASKPDSWRLGRIQRLGAWLSVLPSTVNGTELGSQEWRDSLFLSYGINPPDLLSH